MMGSIGASGGEAVEEDSISGLASTSIVESSLAATDTPPSCAFSPASSSVASVKGNEWARVEGGGDSGRRVREDVDVVEGGQGSGAGACVIASIATAKGWTFLVI